MVILYPLWAQEGWDILAKTEIVLEKDPFMGDEIEMPVFPQTVKQYENKPFVLEGYMIPLQQEKKQNYFVLSRYPYQSCFFCGGAGPETVVEVYTESAIDFVNTRIKVSGQLKLNDTDSFHLFFMLLDSKITLLE